jgi:hypothetical protein
MEISWQITTEDEACVRAILEQQRDADLVRLRREWNLSKTKKPVEREGFWREMVCCRLTARAAGDHLARFEQLASGSDFPLAYDRMREHQAREEFIHNTLANHQVGVDRRKISKELAENFNLLENGEWPHTLSQCNRLICLEPPRETEAEVVDYIDDRFKGFGPKQSRNILQELGLTRYEIPIDNRVANWLNDDLKYPYSDPEGSVRQALLQVNSGRCL